MTDNQAKAATMATRLLEIDAAVFADKCVDSLIKNGWVYAGTVFIRIQPPEKSVFRVMFTRVMGCGNAGTFTTIYIP